MVDVIRDIHGETAVTDKRLSKKFCKMNTIYHFKIILFFCIDSVSKLINFLRFKEGRDPEEIKQMVKITPLMSHSDLRVSSLKKSR